jgi:hypothetical protein
MAFYNASGRFKFKWLASFWINISDIKTAAAKPFNNDKFKRRSGLENTKGIARQWIGRRSEVGIN